MAQAVDSLATEHGPAADDNVLPWDRWFGTLHDGTEESRQRMRRERRMPTEAKGLV